MSDTIGAHNQQKRRATLMMKKKEETIRHHEKQEYQSRRNDALPTAGQSAQSQIRSGDDYWHLDETWTAITAYVAEMYLPGEG